MTMSGNLFQMFKRAVGLGSDLRTNGSVMAPSVLIEELTIAGT